jgi:cytochrome c oxidase subunit IV
MASTTAAHAHDDHAEHPPLGFWVRVAIILAIITAVEVAIYYIPAVEDFLVPLLVALSAIKFLSVIWYFMHLKYDDKLLTGTFGAALAVSIIMFIALWVVMYFDNPTVFHDNMSIFPQKPESP